MADKLVEHVADCANWQMVSTYDRRAITGPCWKVHFPGTADMVRECREVAVTTETVFSVSEDSGWIGRKFSGWDDVVSAVDGTWTEGVAIVEDMVSELNREELPRPTVVRRRRVWDDYAGDEVDVDRWRNADPFFRSNARVRTNGPRVITLITQLGQNSHMESSKIFWRGALTVALSRILEDAGYRTEVVGAGLSKGCYLDGTHSAISVNLKGAGDSLDTGALVNATSGWFFRTVFFGAMYTPRVPVTYSLGQMIEGVSQPLVDMLAGHGSRPWVVSGVYDKKTAVALAKTLLKQLEG